VALAPPTAVEAAIQSLDGQVIGARHLKVRKVPETPKRAKKPGAPKRAARPTAARTASPSSFAPTAPAVVRRAPVVERRTLGGPGYKRVRFFDESKNDRGS
jgi:hypothetical protein